MLAVSCWYVRIVVGPVAMANPCGHGLEVGAGADRVRDVGPQHHRRDPGCGDQPIE